MLLSFRRSPLPAPQWRYACVQRTDPGLVRANNEDAVHAGACGDWSVAVLADGMGGYRAGEVASALAVQCIVQCLQHSAMQLPPQTLPARMAAVHRALEHCVHKSNAAVLAHADRHAECTGMGTTVVAAVFTQDRLVVAHLGDSRAYLWRRGTLRQLTRDHSWLQEQMDAGLLTAEAAARSGQGHLITRALGVAARAQPTLHEEPLEAGDRVLLCSDGLSDMLEAHEIAALLALPQPLSLQADQLIAQANAMGGNDNISVILVAVEPAPDICEG
ncbi:Stp1/IreP family PP2C-type Ser/Thr phosphatase [Comamonas endophytica]|uniref:Stp1/IreP family PP2C-type Ser/Thr phosphatase n=1 Tax=Comamonas endophytica TaxID=2949090 RepID=UPI001E64B600|nr:Stp1/IreP family PP2C-type Ser/Thr phosphatase [Acidovorax sp. D4N7]